MKRVTWKRYARVKRGRSHLSEDVPCQDGVKTLYRRNVSVVALADGAGSAPFSHIGSSICASTLCDVCCHDFDAFWKMPEEKVRASLIASVLDSLLRKGGGEYELCSLASTALVVAVKRNRYVAAHLGDGVIGMRVGDSHGEFLRLLSAPDNGEHSNETTFVTSINALDRLRIYRGLVHDGENRVTGFILMSDGPEAALYRKQDGRLAPACLKLLDAASRGPRFDVGQLLDETLGLIASSKTHDDCSIALMAHV